MKYRHVLSRRTMLRGAGTAAIALPFLDEMRTKSAWGAEDDSLRMVTLFFAMGLPIEYVRWFKEDQNKGPCSPLKAVADKIGIHSRVEYTNEGPPNGHDRGGLGSFTGRVGKNSNQAGGPSIDVTAKNVAYQATEGRTPTAQQFVPMGVYFGRSEAYRYIHSWNNDGSKTEDPLKTPRKLFDRIFGSAAPEPEVNEADQAAQMRESALKKSVLDAVLDDYKRFKSDAGGLSKASRARLGLHLDRIYDIEKKITAQPAAAGAVCRDVQPPEVKVIDNKRNINPQEWMNQWKAMVDIYALGLHCDVFQFGNMMFQGGAERITLKGKWDYNGNEITFDDYSKRQDKGHHEYYHGYRPNDDSPIEVRHHVHHMLSHIVYALQALDNPEYVNANGKTFLEANPVLTTTELGDHGRHQMAEVTHMISGANGKFRTGVVDTDTQHHATNFYRSILGQLSLTEEFGDRDKYRDLKTL